jgi:signal transduction histidine kinase
VEAADDAQHRKIMRLQGRVSQLEYELGHRRELEKQLRLALGRHEKREADLQADLTRLETARAHAERAARRSELFNALLGNELRAPLSTITAGALHLTSLGAGERVNRTATRIVARVDQMSLMIDQLLDFTRIRGEGSLPLSPAEIELAELCRTVKSQLEAKHPKCSIELSQQGATVGHWDGDRLRQVLLCVVGNAVAHGLPRAPVGLHVDGREPHAVTVWVRNRGAVPPELLPVLFEPFRAGARPYASGGLGLGLFISRQIVLAHGGIIDVSSSERDGTTLRLRLPRSP